MTSVFTATTDHRYSFCLFLCCCCCCCCCCCLHLEISMDFAFCLERLLHSVIITAAARSDHCCCCCCCCCCRRRRRRRCCCCRCRCSSTPELLGRRSCPSQLCARSPHTIRYQSALRHGNKRFYKQALPRCVRSACAHVKDKLRSRGSSSAGCAPRQKSFFRLISRPPLPGPRKHFARARAVRIEFAQANGVGSKELSRDGHRKSEQAARHAPADTGSSGGCRDKEVLPPHPCHAYACRCCV